MRSCDKNTLYIISEQICNTSKYFQAIAGYIILLYCTLRRRHLLAIPKSWYLDDALTSPIILVYPVTVSYLYRIVWPGHYAGTWSISYGEHRKLRRARSRGEKTPVDRPADRPVVCS